MFTLRSKDSRWNKGLLLLVLGLALVLSLGLILLNFRFVHSLHYVDSDFFTFWLAGRMNWTGQNPYASAEWLAGHHQQGAQWLPETTFPYPLPLMYFLAPLGLFPVDQAYTLWMYLSQVALVVSILLLLTFYKNYKVKPYVFPILAGAFVFRPTLVTLRNGQLGAFFLLGLTLTAWLWEHKQWFYGGCLLACVLLKPTLGIPIVLLLGLWLLARKYYAAIAGIVFSGLIFLVLGLLRDPNWISNFLNAGNRKLTETFGFSPTFWGMSGTVCGHQPSCSLVVGALFCFVLIGVSGYLLVRRDVSLNMPLVLSLTIPVALLVTPYLWAYDQILLVLPLTIVTLILRREGYPYLPTALIFLTIAILAWLLLVFASTVGHDAWSALISLAGWGMVTGCIQRYARSAPQGMASAT